MSQFRYTAASIAEIVCGEIYGSGNPDQEIRELLIDSRRLVHPDGSMFVALVSDRNDGHRYVPELVERGVGCFLVGSSQFAVGNEGRGTKDEGRGTKDERPGTNNQEPATNNQQPATNNQQPATSNQQPATSNQDPVFILVPDTLAALQKLAARHRKQFSYPVIAVTGSNGKTIVKEWLYQLLSPDLDVI
ncbi:MAG: hypothetical protein ISS17_10490, partial [Bacteroidales bacterium]|nr:hypothetical protein [Bacteroidales bacterium]